MAPYTIAVIGVGKIAQDQHLPVIGKNPDFQLVGVVSGRGLSVGGVPTFRTAAELYAALPDLDAVAICTPPNVRHALAREALDAGVHVLLEKPPFPTTRELVDIGDYAARKDRVVFTTWHSQYNAAVEETRKRLAGQKLKSLAITWKEDVRRWHPGQEWIWEVGGFGVFDPGINALSILTAIMPQPIFVKSARLVTPSNKAMPIAADVVFWSDAEAEPGTGQLTAAFDWRQEGPQSWDYRIETADGTVLDLTLGGSKLAVDGTVVVEAPSAEYEGIYERFAGLLGRRESVLDAAPFQLVADAFMVGRREDTDAFVD
ncbi:Gfo/Idh/MocA family oxidoreductase [Lichenihabitans sp. Uapishka_5]|uniref:Gfo/Idh/MocA family protein n=1 Tax=Lichenihabitans sp. Uapishka_5 TaxID=3037302 RepID=UPI0029E81BB7|nr:Gfo/Idh/MocA family oxidoreductase [Lichenihabitans sp. Uapishka_5]MDX7950131.1 Gfo/Idh/MocA family oxidoreductase [Lichenihabitans sp. Uapishka_5]